MRKAKHSYKGEPIFAKNLILGYSEGKGTRKGSHFFECPYCRKKYYYHNVACKCRDKCYAKILKIRVSKLVRVPSMKEPGVKCRFCGKKHESLTNEAKNCRDFHLYLKYFIVYSLLISRHLERMREIKKEVNKK